jgi:hypothetical protein
MKINESLDQKGVQEFDPSRWIPDRILAQDKGSLVWLVLQVERCRTVTEEKHYAKLTVLAHGNVTPALSFIRREFERHGTPKRHKE